MRMMEPPVSPSELQDALRRFQDTSPWPGVTQIVFRLAGVAILLSWALATWWNGQMLGFWVAGTVLGFWYASFLILTHDAIHHTLTGWRRFDDFAARAMSWPVLWVHATYHEVHLLHHRMNGTNPLDPERVQPTPEELARARGLVRVRLRHQMIWDMLLRGGLGLILETLMKGWSLRAQAPKMVRAIVQDLVGIASVAAGMQVAAYFIGERLEPGRGGQAMLGLAVLWLFMERAIGIVMYVRKHVEHYGLWGERQHFFETQVHACRNVGTNRLMSWFFNQLNFHSVHHAFPRVPFYQLEAAHRELTRLYGQRGVVLPEARGYSGAILDVLKLAWNHESGGSIASRPHRR